MVGGEYTLGPLELTTARQWGTRRLCRRIATVACWSSTISAVEHAPHVLNYSVNGLVPLESRLELPDAADRAEVRFRLRDGLCDQHQTTRILVDEAFLRRIHYKIFASPGRVLREECSTAAAKRVSSSASTSSNVCSSTITGPGSPGLRPARTRRFIWQFLGQPPELTTEVLEAAALRELLRGRQGRPLTVTYA